MDYCNPSIKKGIRKTFSKVTKNDIKLLFEWMDSKQYKVETHEKYRAVLKKYNSELILEFNIRTFDLNIQTSLYPSFFPIMRIKVCGSQNMIISSY